MVSYFMVSSMPSPVSRMKMRAANFSSDRCGLNQVGLATRWRSTVLASEESTDISDGMCLIAMLAEEQGMARWAHATTMAPASAVGLVEEAARGAGVAGVVWSTTDSGGTSGAGRSRPVMASPEADSLFRASRAGSAPSLPPAAELAEGPSVLVPLTGTMAGSASFAGRLARLVHSSKLSVASGAATSFDGGTTEIGVDISAPSMGLGMLEIGTALALVPYCLGRSSPRSCCLL